MPNETADTPQAAPSLEEAVELLKGRLDRIEQALTTVAANVGVTEKLINVIEKLDKDTTSLSDLMDTLHKQRMDIQAQRHDIDKVTHKAGRDRKRFTAAGLVILLISALLYGFNTAQRANSCNLRNAQTAAQSQFIIGLMQPDMMTPGQNQVIAEFLDRSKPLDCSYFSSLSSVLGQ